MRRPEYAVFVILVLALTLAIGMYYVGRYQGQINCGTAVDAPHIKASEVVKMMVGGDLKQPGAKHQDA